MFFISTTTLLFVMCVVLSSANGLTITTAEQLVTFSNDVNKGTSYYGSTIYLGSDIEFTSSLSNQFHPIGKDETNYFNGTFDGQGHVISKLAIINPATSLYTGLFGYSKDATIRNVVMDSSCFVNTLSSANKPAYVGSIVGCFNTAENGFLIEGCVNMGSITFKGDSESQILCLGGIAGDLYYSSVHPITIRNCVNYGAIEKTGKSYSTWVGGVIGLISIEDCYNYLQNCANYGSISHSGSTSHSLGLGGITGNAGKAKIENCLSAGKITSSNYPSSEKKTGGCCGMG